jgi:phosphoribosylanthranilate isomerase
VKICGLTDAGDVRAAVELGAWACGFVLTDSPRHIDPELAAQLASLAGSALTVGVFATEPAADIAAATAEAGLAAVQLSAGPDGCSVDQLRSALSRIEPVRETLVIAAVDTPDVATADFVLFDARGPERYGGTGRRLDWTATAEAAAPFRDRAVLAGGLTPANVAEASRMVEPFAVDVSGGVESDPGVKDVGLLAAFMAAVADERRHAMTTEGLGHDS